MARNERPADREVFDKNFEVSSSKISTVDHYNLQPVRSVKIKVKGIGGDFIEGLKDMLVGGKLTRHERMENTAYFEALHDLINQAKNLGGNAIYNFNVEQTKDRGATYIVLTGQAIQKVNPNEAENFSKVTPATKKRVQEVLTERKETPTRQLPKKPKTAANGVGTAIDIASEFGKAA